MRKKLLSVSITLLGFSLLLTLMLWYACTAHAQKISWAANPTPLPMATSSHSSLVHNGRVYLIAPYGGGGQESPNIYFANVNPDGAVGTWQETTPLPEWRAGAACAGWGDYIYVIGGSGPVWEGRSEQNTVYYTSIDPDGTINAWSSTTLLPERLVGHKAVVWDGKIYVAGGWNGFSRQSKVYFAEISDVDGSLGGWQTTTSLPLSLNQMCAVAYDGAVYLIGGIHNQVPQSYAYYALIQTDGTLGEWTSTSSLPERRARAGLALIDNTIYVIGGQKGQEGVDQTPEKTVYRTTIEAPSLGNWEELESLPEERKLSSGIALNGRIYVIGGQDAELTPRSTIYYSSQGAATLPLLVDAHGEIDYVPWEQVNVKVAALVSSTKTPPELVSGANVSIEIFDPDDNLWISDMMTEKLSPGIYVWESNETVREIFWQGGKGVYTALVKAAHGNAPIASDIVLFHIDPPQPPSSPLPIVVGSGLAVIALVAATAIYIRKKRG
jgi:hypothetical protein